MEKIMHTQQNYQHDQAIKNIPWWPILTGSVVALGISFLFNLLTISMGLSLYTEDDSGQRVLALLGFLWMLLGGYVLLFFAGWTTGKLVNPNNTHAICFGSLLGFVMWSSYLILCLILIGIVNQPAITGLIGSFTPAFQFYNVTQTVNDLGLMGIASFIVLITGALGAMMGAIFGLKR